VIDVCCGRGMQLPALYRHAPHIAGYHGLDVHEPHLAAARGMVANLDRAYGRQPFPIRLHHRDVAEPWPRLPPAPGGHLHRRPAPPARPARGRQPAARRRRAGPRRPPVPVHPHHLRPRPGRPGTGPISPTELLPVLTACGLLIQETIGLLPPAAPETSAAISDRHGPAAGLWYAQLRRIVPAALLDPVVATTTPEVAQEVLHICHPADTHQRTGRRHRAEELPVTARPATTYAKTLRDRGLPRRAALRQDERGLDPEPSTGPPGPRASPAPRCDGAAPCAVRWAISYGPRQERPRARHLAQRPRHVLVFLHQGPQSWIGDRPGMMPGPVDGLVMRSCVCDVW
jgi:hypothetical protein